MPYTISINSATIQQWMVNNVTLQAIEAELHSKGMDAHSIAEHIKEFKRQRNALRQFKGFIYMAVGAFFGFISCVLTLSEAFPQWYDFILYGLTIIGITIAFIGLYFVLE
jgi:hypothetical protein